MAGVYGVWVQSIDNTTSSANVQKYGEVMDVLEEYDMDEATASKQFCDGQTSITPPRYANDNMGMIFTRDRATADMFSGILRDNIAQRITAGELMLSQAPAWVGAAAPVFSVAGAAGMGASVELIREQLAISEAVTNSQIQSQVVAYMGQTGRMEATIEEIAEWIADNALWS